MKSAMKRAALLLALVIGLAAPAHADEWIDLGLNRAGTIHEARTYLRMDGSRAWVRSTPKYGEEVTVYFDVDCGRMITVDLFARRKEFKEYAPGSLGRYFFAIVCGSDPE